MATYTLPTLCQIITTINEVLLLVLNHISKTQSFLFFLIEFLLINSSTLYQLIYSNFINARLEI